MELQTRLQPTGRDPTTKPPNKQKITPKNKTRKTQGQSCRKLLQDTLVGHSCGTLLWNNVKRPSGSRRTRKSSAPKPSAKNAVDSSNLLLATSGLQSDLPVVAARARGPFFGATQRSGQLSIGKLTCQNLRQYTVNTNLRPNGHTRAYSRENKTCSPTEFLHPNLQPRTKQHPTDLHKANLFTFTQTNKRQATDQPKRMVEREVHLECLGASVERPV